MPENISGVPAGRSVFHLTSPLIGLLRHGQSESLLLSHVFVTCHRSPEVSSTAFDAPPPDLPPVHWTDMGFAILGSLARHRRPHIRFWFIGSRLCSTLLSGPASRRGSFHPCALLSLHLHQDWVEDLPGRPGEFRPEPPTDPDVNLSIHPARATQRRLPPSIK